MIQNLFFFFFFFFFRGVGSLSQPRLNIFTVGNMRVMICLGQGGLRSLSASRIIKFLMHNYQLLTCVSFILISHFLQKTKVLQATDHHYGKRENNLTQCHTGVDLNLISLWSFPLLVPSGNTFRPHLHHFCPFNLAYEILLKSRKCEFNSCLQPTRNHWSYACHCWLRHTKGELTLTVLVTAIDALGHRIMTAQWEGMGDVGSARYEPALLPPCPTISLLSYSSCQRTIHSISKWIIRNLAL